MPFSNVSMEALPIYNYASSSLVSFFIGLLIFYNTHVRRDPAELLFFLLYKRHRHQSITRWTDLQDENSIFLNSFHYVYIDNNPANWNIHIVFKDPVTFSSFLLLKTPMDSWCIHWYNY